MFRTHLVIGVFLILLFIPVVAFNKMLFIGVVLLSTFLPDMDMSKSYLGKYKILRPLQWVVKHRGAFHSFTFAVFLTFIFMFEYPVLALPFFLGYAGHLIGDALTPDGIRPWWPLEGEIKWRIRTGGKREKIIFYVVVLANIVLFIRLFAG